MRFKKYCITLILLLFCVGTSLSQESHTEFCIDFRVNSTVIDSTYSDNATRMQNIIEFLSKIRQDSTINIVEVFFSGSASPEGSDQLNRKLASNRLSTLENLIRKEVNIPDNIIIRKDNYIPWNYLKSQIENSELIYKDKVISILQKDSQLVDYHYPNTYIDNRVVKLKELDNGKVWQQINELFFKSMRNACTEFIINKKELPSVQDSVSIPDTIVIASEPIIGDLTDTIAYKETVEEWTRKLHLKTNAIALGMGIANIAAEFDFAKHWSFALPVYYSAWDYFKSTIKFRTLTIQPEIRYWFNEENQGLFIGSHFGYAHYNIALDGNKRYQDHDAKSPALGGGVSIGSRMSISKNNKWHIEFSLGTGVYRLNYDSFYNIKYGKLIETCRKTIWGVDNAAINLSYRFNLKQRKR